MVSVYSIVDEIKKHLRDNPTVNTVTFGDLMEVDLAKTTIYPLSHFTISEVTFYDYIMVFRVSILFLDVVDYTKDYNPDDKGNREDASNLLDVYNTQLTVANDLISHLRRGDLFDDKYQLTGEPSCRMFKDKYENNLAGWSVDLRIEVQNTFSIG